MDKPKLILINGFAAAGKTTVAKRYIKDHPLAFIIEGDELLMNIGGWMQNELEARKLVYELTKSMIRTHLKSGHDVLLPQLIIDATHVDEFENIAEEQGADFYEIVLHSERQDAIAKLLERGRWGEFDSPPISEKDWPNIDMLLAKMESAMEKRPGAHIIPLKNATVDDTYRRLLDHLSQD